MKKTSLIIPIVALLILILFLTGCKTKTVYVPVHSTTTVTELLHDTIVEMRLQVFRDSVSVPDTVSRLENKYAYSTALWTSGRLSHSLGIKPVTIPVEIQYKEIVRTDSIDRPYPVPGPEKIVYRLRWWQEALAWLGALALAFIGFKIGKFFILR
jgi:hypothetical protein